MSICWAIRAAGSESCVGSTGIRATQSIPQPPRAFLLPAVLLRRAALCALRLGRERDHQPGGAAERPEPAGARQRDGQAEVPLPGVRRRW